MRGRWLLRGIGATLLALLVLVFLYPNRMVSPGPLIPAHHELETDCFACHAPLRGVDAQRCIRCHTVADIGLRTTRGIALPRKDLRTSFHQELIEQRCPVCHSDHAGPELTQSNRKPFSHTLLRTAIRDQCQSCHERPADRFHQNLSMNCSQCHTPDHWKPATFDHGRFFVLDGNHNAQCSTCHTTADFTRYTCYGCHEHQPDRIRAEHLEEGIRDFENCVDCHRSASEGSERKESRED